LLQICCIRDLFLRSEWRRRGHLLEGVVPLENLRGGLGRTERLLNLFVGSCKLRGRLVRNPCGGLLHLVYWHEVDRRGAAAEERLVLQVLVDRHCR
jgi:hypothetical protein